MPEPMMKLDMAQRMMQKWGWDKGQGLGKDNNGMTSCLILRKTDGSNTQGRIEQAPRDPMHVRVTKAVAAETAAIAASKEATPEEKAAAAAAAANAARVAAAAAAELTGVTLPEGNAAAAAAAAAAFAGGEDPEAKRRRTSKWEGDQANLSAMSVYDPVQAQLMAVAATPPIGAKPLPDPTPGAIPLRKPNSKGPTRGPRPWIWRQPEDWRWSKGTAILKYTQELDLPPHMQSLARKILGENSKYPTRFADYTDCVVECTAWGTLLLRPRGTAADLDKAKQLIWEVFHPSQSELRREVLQTGDDPIEDVENSGEATLRSLGDDRDRFEQGLERAAHGKLNRVGIGAEDEVRKKTQDKEKEKLEAEEVPLPTSEDVNLVRTHMEDLKIASGVSALLSGATLKLIGKAKPLKKARRLLNTLLETGEWAALESGFILSEETKQKRQGQNYDGPSEQILIKVPDGKLTLLIEQKLKMIERAAEADVMKLTSKPIAGKRTLMVEGSKKAHERVKLMVKELSEKGDSPMLTKAIYKQLAEDTPSMANVAPPARPTPLPSEGPRGPLPDGAAAVAGMRLMAPPRKVPAGEAAAHVAALAPLSATAAAGAADAAPGALFAGLPPGMASPVPPLPVPKPMPAAVPGAATGPSAAPPAAKDVPNLASVVFPPEPPNMGAGPDMMKVDPPEGTPPQSDYFHAALKAAERQLAEIAAASSMPPGALAPSAPAQGATALPPAGPTLAAPPLAAAAQAKVAAENAAATALAAALEVPQQLQHEQKLVEMVNAQGAASSGAAEAAAATALEPPQASTAPAAAASTAAPAAPAAPAAEPVIE